MIPTATKAAGADAKPAAPITGAGIEMARASKWERQVGPGQRGLARVEGSLGQRLAATMVPTWKEKC